MIRRTSADLYFIAMPIVDAVCRLLSGEVAAGEVVAHLLARPLRAEQEGAR